VGCRNPSAVFAALTSCCALGAGGDARPLASASSKRKLRLMKKLQLMPRAVAAVVVAGAVAAGAASPALAAPDRGFELVGPPDGLGYTVQGFAAQPDGEALYWTGVAGEQTVDPAPADGALGDVFLARRSADGWASTWLTPDPAGLSAPRDASEGLPGMRADGFMFFNQGAFVDPGGAGAPALYLGDGSGSSSRLLSAVPGTSEQAGLDRSQWVTSEDLSSAVFATIAPLDPGDTDSNADLYVRRGTTLSLITRQTSGAPDNTATDPYLPQAVSGTKDGTGGDGPLNVNLLSRTGFPVSQGGSPVSPDGRSIVFSTTAPLDGADTDTAADVYLWREGQGASLISDDERGAPGCPTVPGSTTDCTDTSADVSFVGMSEDASIIYLRTREGLVDGDTDGGNDIYQYRVSAPAGQGLTQATGTGASDEVWPVSVTADGQLFFAATDRLGVDPPSGTGAVLYRWDATTVVTVSALTDDDIFDNVNLKGDGIASPSPAERAVRATADGSALLFRTTAALDPADTDSTADLYLWRAGRGVTLVSGTGAAAVTIGTPRDAYVGPRYPAYGGGRGISADGSRVFFTSTDALTDDAGDNGRAKLYEWRDGTGVDLVSPADDDAGAVSYVDNSADGVNVFFMTGDALVSGDTDGGGMDTYDARIGGGFPEPPAPPAPCAGDPCQGPPSPKPVAPVAVSIAFAGSADPGPLPPVAKPKVSKPKAVRGTQATLRVALPSAGRLQTSGSGLTRAAKTASKAGTYTVGVRLTERARRTLQRKRRLTVTVRVVFIPLGGQALTVTARLTFKQPTGHTSSRKGH
jgi:hypothetical protein